MSAAKRQSDEIGARVGAKLRRHPVLVEPGVKTTTPPDRALFSCSRACPAICSLSAAVKKGTTHQWDKTDCERRDGVWPA